MRVVSVGRQSLWWRIRHHVAGVAVAGLAGSALVVLAPVAEASAAPKSTMVVKIQAPQGVPVTALVSGGTKAVVTKAETAPKLSKKLAVKPGTYKVKVDPFTFNGRLYVAQVSQPKLSVAKGAKVATVIKVKQAKVADRIVVETIDKSSVTLSWSLPKGAKTVLRRSTGEVAPASPRAGTGVKVSGAGAKDVGLDMGGTYSYSLFTQLDGQWSPPVSVTASTTAADNVTWMAPTSTTIVKPGEADQLVSMGPGSVVVQLAPGRRTPTLGSGFVLPVMPGLEGGYIGRVTDVSPAGDQVTVTAGGFADAFDYFDAKLDLSTLPEVTLEPVDQPTLARAARGTSGAPQAAAMRRGTGLAPCPKGTDFGTNLKSKISLSPGVKPDGTFHPYIKRLYKVPTTAHFDLRATLTFNLRADVELQKDMSCSMQFGTYTKTLVGTSPVPIVFKFTPYVDFVFGGAVKITGMTVSATTGFEVNGSFGKENSVSARPVNYMTSSGGVGSGGASISAEIIGELMLGPGLATSDAGIMAGALAEVTALGLKGEVFTPPPPATGAGKNCWKVSAYSNYAFGIRGTAWIDPFKFEKTLTFPELGGSKEWTSFTFPNGCDKPSPFRSREVAGDGVTQTGDSFVGDERQTARVEGFGESAWVLSTGDVGDTIGSPKRQVSTNLGRPGLPTLTSLINAPTFDGASYKTTVVPTGSNLNVRFLFASEEYPKYIGGKYNDVAAVFIDGQACSPNGLTGPISVNQINAGKNSHLFVDNANGAAGYGTTMDGLTVPLTCSKAVTPGVPVTVEFMVADAGDGDLDSAIALLDGGITSN